MRGARVLFKSPARRFALNSQELRLEGKPPSSADLRDGSRAGTRGGAAWLWERGQKPHIEPGELNHPRSLALSGTGGMVHLHSMKQF